MKCRGFRLFQSACTHRAFLIFTGVFLVFSAPVYSQLVADGATNTLANVTNPITGSVTVGTNGSFTLLVLSNNCLVTNTSTSTIGLNATAKSNEVRLISSTARWRMGGTLFVGSNGIASRLVVSNGALLESGSLTVGNHPAGSNNEAIITGPGSTLNAPGLMFVGADGNANRLTILNGGSVFVTNSGSSAFVGFNQGMRSNSALVADPGSRWSVNNTLVVGQAANAGTLIVSNGATVDSANGTIGSALTASNNLVLVTGAGSTWSNSVSLKVGDIGPGSQLIVSNGGNVVVGGSAYVGATPFFSAGNRVTVDGGTLRVTNASATGLLDVRRGTLTLNAGLLEVDQLLVTNTPSAFTFNGGTLTARSSTVNNDQAFRVGNATNSATFELAGNGVHSFSNGLAIMVNGFLKGSGTINGGFQVSAGGFVSPGGAIGKFISTSPFALALSGTELMDISKSGSTLTNDQVQAAGGIMFGNGGLIVTDIGPDSLASGDRFQLFSATSYTGSFQSVSLPPLSPFLSWTNKVLVDGSIEVVGLGVQTLPATAIGSASATLNGTANPGGLAAAAWFEYGFTTNYGSVTAPQALGSGVVNANFSQVLTGLFGGVTYHFRALASNSLGLVFGADQTFSLPAFTNSGVVFPTIVEGSAAWGDYDGDGRLDLLLTGTTNSGAPNSAISQIWRNTGNGFTNINAGLPGVYSSAVAWGDYDNDGRLDILLSGTTNASNPEIARVWRNTGSGFTRMDVGLPGPVMGSAAWGDFDNDGHLDLLLTGTTDGFGSGSIHPVWRNAGSFFTDANAGLPAVTTSSTAWGDYDNDGRLDILIAGYNNDTVQSILQVWRNTGNGFTNINAGLPGIAGGSVAWGDYDNDGRLDILLTGSTNGPGAISQVWRNTGAGFTNINAGLPSVTYGAAAWGDYDNDGKLDILLVGTTNDLLSGVISQIWRNTGSGFTNINAGLPGVMMPAIAWGDYDNDGRLDFFLAGFNTSGQLVSQLWHNTTPVTNTPPAAPTGLAASVADNIITFSWNPATDAQTPADGLFYNLRVGTTPGGSEIVPAMSLGSGARLLPQIGNVGHRTAWTLKGTTDVTYYWSVQAVDSAFAGSPFAAGSSFALHSVFGPPGSTAPVPGDANGDGVVDSTEFAAVLTNYLPNNPFLYMTNVAGLGGTNVTFALTNSFVGAFSVEFTTNLVDWYFLGPATPRYLFTDTNAPAVPQRYYRLRWP